MLGLRQSGMDGLLKSVLIALVFVFAVVLLAACPDGLGADCDHACCARADRSRAFHRLVSRLKAAFSSAVGMLTRLLASVVGHTTQSHLWVASAQPIPEVSVLRI